MRSSGGLLDSIEESISDGWSLPTGMEVFYDGFYLDGYLHPVAHHPQITDNPHPWMRSTNKAAFARWVESLLQDEIRILVARLKKALIQRHLKTLDI